MIVLIEIFLFNCRATKYLIKYFQKLIVQLNFQLVFSNFSILNPEIGKAFKLNWQLCLCVNLVLVGFFFVDFFVWDFFFWLSIVQCFDFEKRLHMRNFSNHRVMKMAFLYSF